MIQFDKIKGLLVLTYSNENGSIYWFKQKLIKEGYVKLSKTFELRKEDLYPSDNSSEWSDEMEDEYQFIIGKLKGDYYKLKKSIFQLKNKIYFFKDTKFKVSYFKTNTNASILPKLDKLITEPIYIGGTESGNGKISIVEYEALLKFMPNSYEVKLYSESRIESVLSNYISTKDDAENKFNSYLNKKLDFSANKDLTKMFNEYEIEKLGTILNQLEEMLSNEKKYSEKQWQEKILQILLLLFPKYIAVFDEVRFEDIYSGKTRRLDYLLIDYLGHIDIIEIKKPMDAGLVSKNHYRDNHIPKRELSGTIMQIEKYIYYLNKWGRKGEEKLTKKYKKQLPEDLNIKITNPNGIIIMGRESGLNSDQLNDLEIIKRKYKNVVDIITYDDLIKRIQIAMEEMKKI